MGNPILINFLMNFHEEIENAKKRYVSILYSIFILNFFRQQLRLEFRFLRDSSNSFDLPNEKFIKLFRLNKLTVHYLIEEIQEFLDEQTRRDTVSLRLQVWCCF